MAYTNPRLNMMDQFIPDYNDPQLGLSRARIGFNYDQSRSSDLNEINRAGLLGSSAASAIMNRNTADRNRAMESSDADIFGRQRDYYMDIERLKRMRRYQQEDADRATLLSGVQGLGSLGYLLGGGY